MKQGLSLLLSLGYCTLSQSIFLRPTSAQVASDGTTSTTVDVSGSDFTIQEGERAGGNLFHSFSDFSVPTDGSAFFNNATDIVNIFSRVTGGNISNIDGLLRANGSANLFLLNPAGIIFGENARLDIGGSFLGTTADSFLFEDGEFSATDLDNPPLITINAPIGLNFRDNPGEIVNRSFVQNSTGDFVGLEVRPGNSLTLVGGNINFEAGEATASGGNIELGGLSEAGTITLNDDGSLSFPEDVAQADITLSNAADVDVRGTGEGSITINTRNLNLEVGEFGSSQIRAGITADSTSADAQAGDITINATDNVTVDDSSIANQVNSRAVGNAGGVTITTGSLSLTNGGGIETSTFGQGNGGSVEITASDTITIDGETSAGFGSGISSFVGLEAVGDAGDLTINTASLSLTNGGFVSTSTTGQGDGGSVEITANDTIIIDGETSAGFVSGVSTLVASEEVGNAGDVTISTGSLSLTNGGVVSADTSGQGNGGSVEITASDTITIDGESSNGFASRVFSAVGRGAVGDAGSVTINTGSLFLTNGGEVSTSTLGQGNGGLVEITASNTIIIDGETSSRGFPSFVSTQVGSGAVGDAGSVTINTGSLSLTNGGEIETNTSGQGNGGLVDITASDTIIIDGEQSDGIPSNIFSGVLPGAVGNAGDVTINSDSLSLTNGGEIETTTSGQGNAGLVEITASDTITVDGETSAGFPSGVFSTVNLGALGNARGVTITTGSLNLTNGGQVDASTNGEGNAGLVNIMATDTITIDGEQANGFPSSASSRVNSGAVGNSGGVTITTRFLTLTNGGRVGASTFGQGNAGSLEIKASDNITVDGENSNGIPSGASSRVALGALGNAGDVSITTGFLTLTNGGRIGASTLGSGNAGNVTVNARESIIINGVTENNRSGLSASALVNRGNGGNVNVFTKKLTIDDGGTIGAGNFDSLAIFNPGTGEPGNINIQANSLSLNNEARIQASTQSETGNRANINLQLTEDLILRNNSFISARAFEEANGGNLNIDTRFIVAFPSQFDGNDILASAERGQGGNINITAEALFGIEERPLNPLTNDLNASSEFGLDGDVSIVTPDINKIQTDIELPNNIVETETLGANACSGGVAREASSFTVKGKGGLPPVPTEPFMADSLVPDGKPITIDKENNLNSLLEGESETEQENSNYIPEDIKPIKTSRGDIYPARGIIKTEDGRVILTTYPTDNINTRTPNIAANCSLLKDEEGS